MERTEDMIAADAEIEREFCLTVAEINASRERDGDVEHWRLDNAAREAKEKKRERAKKYYWEHRDTQRAKAKAYREQNRERIAERTNQWYVENREYAAQRQKSYREEHREEIALRRRLAYQVEKAYRKIMREMEDEQKCQ